jgi:hypothetical protein
MWNIKDLELQRGSRVGELRSIISPSFPSRSFFSVRMK